MEYEELGLNTFVFVDVTREKNSQYRQSCRPRHLALFFVQFPDVLLVVLAHVVFPLTLLVYRYE